MQDKMPKNEQELPHGRWEIYHHESTDEIYYIGTYVNGLEYGYEMAMYDAAKGLTPESYYAR
jgi:hypothetical protein